MLVFLAACGGDDAAVAPDARPALDAALSVVDGAPAIADAAPEPDAPPLTGQILTDLAAIPGMTAREGMSETTGYRYFILTYDQPVDHDNPAGERFQQRIRILHRAYDAPTVLITEGYFVQTTARRIELSSLLNANQISVEHRFFTPSRPQSADWSKLTIWQAATDHHRIVRALRHIYTGNWLNTGASKGGMTAVYHRRFYPDDVNGTVAYVAPLSFGHDDPRYVPFVDVDGPSDDCNLQLQQFQRRVLTEPLRSNLIARMGSSFTRLKPGEALEHSTLELPFGFWQYDGASSCPLVPGSGANADAHWGFMVDYGLIFDYDDQDVNDYAPYYYQAETQLGTPGVDTQRVADLLQFPYDLRDYLPAPGPFDATAMPDVDTWVKAHGEGLLFVYGEYDPWTAGAFNLGDGSADCFKLVVPAGNHGSKIANLPSASKAVALDAIRRWSGLPALPKAKVTDEVLESMIRGRPPL